MTKFNLVQAMERAEGGDASQWETIARHLIAAQPKPKARKSKANGPQTWATVRLEDGRVFLTSAYARQTEEQTAAAHAAYAQYRARMEDSGDRDQNGTSHPQKRRTLGPIVTRVFLNPAIKPVPVARVDIITDETVLENSRNWCHDQRAARQGWVSGFAPSYAIAAE